MNETSAPRKIIHCDMDAFYASVEQKDQPSLRGKPVVVGGDPRGRGVVAACSYEARRFGIRSAMSSAKALKLCPEVIFVSPRFSRYQEMSVQIHEIFESFTSKVEAISLDEAYLDVTENTLNEPIAQKIAKLIQEQIYQKTGLTSSAGVGPNKLIAKIASDFQKPNGLTVVPPHRVSGFLEKLPIEKLWGVGPATAKQLHALGIRVVSDIRTFTPHFLEERLGKYGSFLHGLSHGIDHRPVESGSDPKSRGTETTFSRDITDILVLTQTLQNQSLEMEMNLKNMQLSARTITLKVKYSNFKSVTRSRTLIDPTERAETIFQVAEELLKSSTEAGSRAIRLIGISVSTFVRPDEPLQLWLNLDLTLHSTFNS
jgi:DNA polymerase-4